MPYNTLRKGRYSIHGQIYHIVLTTANRLPIFAELYCGRIVVQRMIELQQEGWTSTLCYVVMPDHLHWLIQLEQGSLAGAIARLKARTSKILGRKIWQTNYFDHALRSEENIKAVARYIVANPIRAGLVQCIGDYSLWDAVWINNEVFE